MDADTTSPNKSLADRFTTAPKSCSEPRVAADYDALISKAKEQAHGTLAELLERAAVKEVICGVISGSPYLAQLIRTNPGRLYRILQTDPDRLFDDLVAEVCNNVSGADDRASVMKALRKFKANVALLTGLADLGGVWPVMRVTDVLTECADVALQSAVVFLFRQAVRAGDWIETETDVQAHDSPASHSGYIVLAMGKHGARELNYSSDIDLIIFFDPARATVRDGLEVQSFFVRMTRDLVQLMEERTGDGYVFRTDLRLRPDAGATQAALSVNAALNYYESVGQNWERAALIKARPVAGDIEAGQDLLDQLSPYIWRKYLDFAAIADIHAMKRQVHAFRGLGDITLAGHNVKLGRGGIREIEFFVQTQQLIAGGRQPDLRVRQTLEVLKRLAARGWITEETRDELDHAYRYLRTLEHRIQMVADEQTHELPNNAERLHSFARFAGYEDTDALGAALIPILKTVQAHYGELFEDPPDQPGPGMNLVFAGEDDDPDTLANLSNLGFGNPKQVVAGVRAWHRGRYPAVRSKTGQQLLTEVQPALVKALAETADPDRAFAEFDRFLSALPAGVQLFSILKTNPKLLTLLADIMGTAPRMARILSRRRRLLDAVLDPRTFSVLPDGAEIDQIIETEFEGARDFQDHLDRARIVGNEQMFLIGVRVLTGTINASKAGRAYALLAERLIAALTQVVEDELETAHGGFAGEGTAIVTMGKLGGHEMTASSDLDLILVYEVAEGQLESDGRKPLAPSQYYARLTQRLIMALSAPTAEGLLYEVDMRLRPSGNQGPVATAYESFVSYQAQDAWTWEHMALTRARVITGTAKLKSKVRKTIYDVLVRPRAPDSIARDVEDMRTRILAEKQTDNIWDLKQVRGGLVDLEFVTQYLQLIHAHAHPDVLDQTTTEALRNLTEANCLDPSDGDALMAAARLLHDLGQILRLCLDDAFDPQRAPQGLKDLLARAGDSPSFEALEVKLRDTLATVHGIYRTLISARATPVA